MNDANASSAREAGHWTAGWVFLFVFLSMGLLLEALHGLKLGFYLDLANQTRRHLWTLAHAHGTLVGLLHIAFAATLRLRECADAPGVALASRCLHAGAVLLPAGFFLGGLVFYAGDPGLGVLLSPIGGALLVVCAALTVRAAR